MDRAQDKRISAKKSREKLYKKIDDLEYQYYLIFGKKAQGWKKKSYERVKSHGFTSKERNRSSAMRSRIRRRNYINYLEKVIYKNIQNKLINDNIDNIDDILIPNIQHTNYIDEFLIYNL